MENQSDFYWEGDLVVFTEAYHLKRGYCCNSGCRHCPYRNKNKGMKKVTISWSGGKDSAFALYKTVSSGAFEIVSLHTVIDEQTRRVGLHGISEALIEKQAYAIGLPLEKIYLPASEDSQQYQTCMQNYYQRCGHEGVEGIVFGDIFLEDLKEYRLGLLKPYELFASFPLWGIDTKQLVKDFINAGFKSMVCAADANLFEAKKLGSVIDDIFLQSLSPAIDPCGENGEFHSFVFDGPLFKQSLSLTKGDVVKKNYAYQKKNERGDLEKLESAFLFLDLR